MRFDMAAISQNEFRVSVVLYPEGDFWIAQGIEYDITARGRTAVEASDRFHDKVGAELIISMDVEDSEALAHIGPAPEKFRALFTQTKLRFVADEIPLRLASGTPGPIVIIADRRLAA
jgi:hypothetical protein